jgi:hypothetical protein
VIKDSTLKAGISALVNGLEGVHQSFSSFVFSHHLRLQQQGVISEAKKKKKKSKNKNKKTLTRQEIYLYLDLGFPCI